MADAIRGQADDLMDKLLDAARKDGILRQTRLVPLARARLLRFIQGVAAGFSMCENCDGAGTTGCVIPGSDFQPPEGERCGSCGGSGRCELPPDAPALDVCQSCSGSGSKGPTGCTDRLGTGRVRDVYGPPGGEAREPDGYLNLRAGMAISPMQYATVANKSEWRAFNFADGVARQDRETR
ncbi:hypothetical protein [Ramlibacter sp. AN1133]|uniref:hypothetical protein n=1 Tax=Ramlibacter sp. AN1133 TaxID=3133429 RepID=UPI0030BF3410